MTPTVQRQLRKRQVTTNDLTPWAIEELFPLLSEMRQALNYLATQNPPPFTTAGTGVFTTVWSSADVASGTAVRIDARVIGTASANRSAFTITGLFYNTGAGTTQEGVTSAGYTQNAAGFAVQFAVSSNHIELQVKDAGGLTVSWDAYVEAQEN